MPIESEWVVGREPEVRQPFLITAPELPYLSPRSPSPQLGLMREGLRSPHSESTAFAISHPSVCRPPALVLSLVLVSRLRPLALSLRVPGLGSLPLSPESPFRNAMLGAIFRPCQQRLAFECLSQPPALPLYVIPVYGFASEALRSPLSLTLFKNPSPCFPVLSWSRRLKASKFPF